MNFSNFESLVINGHSFQRLVRVSDGAVLFEKNPQPKPWFKIEYDGSQSSVFVGNVYAGFYGGQVEIDWGDGTTETVNVPSGGGSAQIRRNDVYGTRVITFKSPCSFFIPLVNSVTMRGITKLMDFGNNIEFRNTTDSSGYIKPGLFNWSNLQILDLHGRTSVPGLTQADYFDTNTNLQQIIIPKALEQDFRSDSRWSKYQDKFIIK